MQPKYEYRRRLPHYQKDDHPLFVTFTTDRRWELPPEAGDVVLECCLKENGQELELHAAVVMPITFTSSTPRFVARTAGVMAFLKS